MRQKSILMIEDEEAIRDILGYSLRKEGFVVQEAGTGSAGLEQLEKYRPDLVLLDLMLPDMSGFDLCRKLSVNLRIPVIMITAKSDMLDKVLGMELGADDYITKPFDIREVVARIRAIFRRIELISESLENQSYPVIRLGTRIEIHKEEREVWRNGIKVNLTNKEYDLLLFLVIHHRRVFTRSELLDRVWGFEFAGDTRTVDIHVQRIRKKLDTDQGASIIETVFGVGYKLDMQVRA
ncbi:Transcriptional regulatory protein, C terminal [Paenibacillus algorifonticola]|uniref:Transcriptional regulatory protein, C terminal n=1 Tax=Paenibacillus algorifonticola TaxID=684063 RepID=A0A1I2F651_9BACL|nr:response regulator transcription factor [Paenibacillus algorifonticola]SFF00832.1 Transcriptional regulatory protein, C terminal [Paenibacillus algorifonticola]